MIYALANTDLVLDGIATTGEIKSIELENVKANTEKYSALGKLFDKDLPVGFDQMKGKLMFASASPLLMAKLANPWQAVPLIILGVMMDKSMGGTQLNKQFKADLICRPVELGLGKFENQKLTDFDRDFLIDKATITMDGVEQLHWDAENDIYRINGQDVWQTNRSILGQP